MPVSSRDAAPSLTGYLVVLAVIGLLAYSIYYQLQPPNTSPNNVYVFPSATPVETERIPAYFNGATTDLTLVDLAAVEELTLEREGIGKIVFKGTVDTRNTNFDDALVLLPNYVSIDSTKNSQFGVGGTVTFNVQGDFRGLCYAPGFAVSTDKCTPCPDEICTNVRFEDNRLVFETTSFSTFFVPNEEIAQESYGEIASDAEALDTEDSAVTPSEIEFTNIGGVDEGDDVFESFVSLPIPEGVQLWNFNLATEQPQACDQVSAQAFPELSYASVSASREVLEGLIAETDCTYYLDYSPPGEISSQATVAIIVTLAPVQPSVDADVTIEE